MMRPRPILSVKTQLNQAISGFNAVRNRTSTWVLVLGLFAGIVCSFAIILNWFDGAAYNHGGKGLVTAVIYTALIVGFTIDSEVRLVRKVARKR